MTAVRRPDRALSVNWSGDSTFPGSAFITAFMAMHRVTWTCHRDVDGWCSMRAERAHWAVETGRDAVFTREMGMALVELVRDHLTIWD